MMLARMTMILLMAGLAACGEGEMLACDEGPYLAAVRADKVQAPEGLDDLNPLNEVPLPEASPRGDRADDAPCLEHPPRIISIE